MNVAPVDTVSIASLATDAGMSASAGAPAKAVDIASFQNAMSQASAGAANSQVAQTGMPSEISPAFKAVLEPLMALNDKAQALGTRANQISSINGDLKPSQLVEMTFQCYQFMFQSEVTSNVANRTSDGVRQLFRQQS